MDSHGSTSIIWTADGDDPAEWLVQQSATQSGGFSASSSILGSARSVDAVDEEAWYRIAAGDGEGVPTGDWSNVVGTYQPNLHNTGGGDLEWNQPASEPDHYRIESAVIEAGPYGFVANVAGNVGDYSAGAETLWYRVQGFYLDNRPFCTRSDPAHVV